MCYVGLTVWVLSYLYFTLLALASERLSLKTRVAYFRSLITQDISFLEKQGSPQELSTNMLR